MVLRVKGKEEIERKKSRCLAGVAGCRILARVAMCVAAVHSLPYNGRILRSPNIGRGVGGKPIKSGRDVTIRLNLTCF